MNNALQATTFDLRRAATCAALATLTTLGMFSLIANVMPPLMAEGLVLASSQQKLCVPAARVLHAGATKDQAG